MNCKDCGKPIHATGLAEQPYGHDELIDSWFCTGLGPIEPEPALADYIGRHITDAELNRRITVNYGEREATHAAMVAMPGCRPLVDPLGQEWADLSARFAALCGQSDALYAELARRG